MGKTPEYTMNAIKAYREKWYFPNVKLPKEAKERYLALGMTEKEIAPYISELALKDLEQIEEMQREAEEEQERTEPVRKKPTIQPEQKTYREWTAEEIAAEQARIDKKTAEIEQAKKYAFENERRYITLVECPEGKEKYNQVIPWKTLVEASQCGAGIYSGLSDEDKKEFYIHIVSVKRSDLKDDAVNEDGRTDWTKYEAFTEEPTGFDSRKALKQDF